MKTVFFKSTLPGIWVAAALLCASCAKDDEPDEITTPTEVVDISEYITAGRDYARAGEFDKAIVEFSTAIELNPNAAEAYFWRGNVYYNLQKDKEAFVDCNQALNLNPNYVEAYYLRALLYLISEQTDLAIADCSQAIVLQPDYMDAYYLRGTAYLNMHDYNNAEIDYNYAVGLTSDTEELIMCYHNLSLVFLGTGEYDKAIAYCNKGIELGDNSAYIDRGMAYLKQKEYDRAIDDYTNVIDRGPDECVSVAYNNRAEALNFKGEYAKALVDANKAIELSLDDGAFYDGEFYDTRGYIYCLSGDSDKALADFNTAIDLGGTSSSPIFYYHRALTYRDKGDKTAAVADCIKAVTLDTYGEYPEAAALLTQLLGATDS
jgi:tetratricopeptide (TPR) repeat protein